MREKITVLFLAADPLREGARRELDEEMHAIQRALQRGSARDKLKFVTHFGTGARDLQAALLRHQPRIVHFAGPGIIRLGDEHGHPQAVGGETLRELFGIPGGGVRVVVLSGCDPLGIIQPLSEVVDYAVATNTLIGEDGSSAAFVDAFYTALAMGRTVLAAFELGLSRLEGNPGAATPVRRIRRGVNLDATLVPRPEGGEEREGRRWARPRAWVPARRS